MKKKLLPLLALVAICSFNLPAKADTNASATFTGTLETYYSVVKSHDGVGGIADDGTLTTTTAQDFTVSTNGSACSGYLTTAQVASTPTMASPGGTTYVALTTTGADAGKIGDTLGTDAPTVANNASVIAYTIAVTPDSGTAFTWNATDSRLEGAVLAAAGSKLVATSLGTTPRTNTFGPNDPAGAYTATMTLTAVASL